MGRKFDHSTIDTLDFLGYIYLPPRIRWRHDIRCGSRLYLTEHRGEDPKIIIRTEDQWKKYADDKINAAKGWLRKNREKNLLKLHEQVVVDKYGRLQIPNMLRLICGEVVIVRDMNSYIEMIPADKTSA